MKTLFPITFLLLGCFLFIFSCNKRAGGVTYKNKTFINKYISPPGTIRIGENLFADESEITNLYYREYLLWTKKVLGDSIYNLNLPDTLVWELEDGYNEPFVEAYFQHPAYDRYPVVGLSYDQAVRYLEWRSDRVYEMLLISEKVLDYNFEQNADNYFTIEKYLSGNYFGITPDTSTISLVPAYRLPSEEEWEFLASSGLNTSEYPYGYNTESGRVYKIMNKKKYRNSKLYNLKYPSPAADANLNTTAVITAPSHSFLPNDFGIYHTIGNVAEMTTEKGVAKGGSYLHAKGESAIPNRLGYSKPTRWLGFRGVCTWEPVSEYSKQVLIQ